MARREQVDRDAWIEVALRAMAEGGLKSVGVEWLAPALGVTKGSFYWHFANRDALLLAAAEAWEARETEVLAQATSAIADPRARLVALIERAHTERGLRLSRAFTVSADHPLLGPSVRRVTKRRLAFLSECFAAIGAAADDCKHAARMVYAAYLGLAELGALGLGAQNKVEMRAYVDRMVAALVPATRS